MKAPIYSEPPGMFRVMDWPTGMHGLWMLVRLISAGRIWFIHRVSGQYLLAWGVFDQADSVLFARRQVPAVVRRETWYDDRHRCPVFGTRLARSRIRAFGRERPYNFSPTVPAMTTERQAMAAGGATP